MKPWQTALILVAALVLKEFVFDNLFADLFSHLTERSGALWEIVSAQWLDRPYGVGVNRQAAQELFHAQ